ncbi:MAG TPA: hypothetical protein VNX26_05035 [Candidatus Acidoferrum sp.]|nr:hypothetical protein [Candidatus Acidoferrum sp.]
MIKNFNFYDIYGYLIPGLTVLGVLWLPFGLATGAWPAQEWSSALIVIVLGYVAGHVLQTFTHIALPDRFGGRFPSESLLDAKDRRFTDEFKDLLCKKINSVFKIAARFDKGSGAVMEDRGIAFFLCRSALMQCRAGAYAEQAQGMYVLARGLSAAFALGAALHFGWVAGSICETNWPGQSRVALFTGVGALAAIVAAVFFARRERHASEDKKTRPQLGSAIFLTTTVLLLGVVLGHNYPALQVKGTKPDAAEGQQTCCVKIIDTCCHERTAPEEVIYKTNSGIANSFPLRGWLLGLTLVEILFSLKLYDTFKRFAVIFAQSVYRDFVALGACSKPGTADAAVPDDDEE